MEFFVALAAAAGLIYWSFRAGKREGSRKAYFVGRRGRRRR